jgi:hypothetical protein
MRIPRFTISGMMALVLLVALDAWACKALMGSPLFSAPVTELIVLGALPMANVLALGLYPILMSRHKHESGRPGLVGFEVGGLAALLLYLACSVLMPHPIHWGVGNLLRTIGFVPGPALLAGAVVLLLIPQVALAILGARLGRTYKFRVILIVERRSPSGAGPEPTPNGLAIAQGS